MAEYIEEIEVDPEDTVDETSMVDWKNPPSLDDLKHDYLEAKDSHTNHVRKVEEWLSALRGELNIKPREGRSRIQPKLVRKQNEWRYAALEEPFLSTDDMFVVNPVTYQDVDAARQNMLILNKQFRVDIPKIKFINKYIRTAVNTGTVIVKLSWETEVDTAIEEVPVYTQTPEETMMVLQQMLQQGQIDEQTAQQMAMSGQPIQIGTEPQEVEEEVINRPVLQVKDSRNVIIDPSCEGDIDNAKFIIDRWYSDLSTLKKDGRYVNLDNLIDEEGNTELDSHDYRDYTSFRFKDKPRSKLLVHEYWGYWDINGDGIVRPIVATWVGNTLIRLEENPYPDKKLPFVVVQYLPPDHDTVYGDADASLLIDNQNIIGAVSRSIIDLIGRSANAQQGVRKDLLDPINRDRFNKGMDFEYNPVSNLGDALYMTKLPEIPKSAMDMINLENAEAEALTGVKAFTGGISGDALGSNVGGIRSALDATAKRELGILRRLSDGLKQIGRKIIAMNSVWLSDEEVIRITDDEFVAIKRSDLAGNFDLTINVSTAELDNQKAEELAFMLQTLGQSVPFDIMKMVLVKIAELRKLPDLAKAVSDYVPQPDPLQQKQAELQIALLEAQVENEKAKAFENQTDVELKQAKTQVELAKAGKTNSERDKLDLDYVEQATGLKQDRELEKQKMDNDSRERMQMLNNQANAEQGLMDNLFTTAQKKDDNIVKMQQLRNQAKNKSTTNKK